MKPNSLITTKQNSFNARAAYDSHLAPMRPSFLLDITPSKQCSRLKSSMPFKLDLALQNIPLSKQPFKMQPHIKHEDFT
jgi:hypothetical protein